MIKILKKKKLNNEEKWCKRYTLMYNIMHDEAE
jgi:hypothetical protein